VVHLSPPAKPRLLWQNRDDDGQIDNPPLYSSRKALHMTRLLERAIVLENDAYPSWASVSCYISQLKPPEGKIQGCIEYGWSTTPYHMYTGKQTLTKASCTSSDTLHLISNPLSNSPLSGPSLPSFTPSSGESQCELQMKWCVRRKGKR
jgi:hypothetical protein